MGSSLEVVPFGDFKLLAAKRDGGSSRDGSIVGVKDGRYFELEDYLSSKKEEEEVVGYPLAL